jgi:hypothetical protein
MKKSIISAKLIMVLGLWGFLSCSKSIDAERDQMDSGTARWTPGGKPVLKKTPRTICTQPT